MATLTPTQITRAGVAAPASAASNTGDEWVNAGLDTFRVQNDHVSNSVTVSFALSGQPTVDGVSVPAKTVVVANQVVRHIGPFPPALYNDANSKVQVTYNTVANVLVGVLRVG